MKGESMATRTLHKVIPATEPKPQPPAPDADRSDVGAQDALSEAWDLARGMDYLLGLGSSNSDGIDKHACWALGTVAGRLSDHLATIDAYFREAK